MGPKHPLQNRETDPLQFVLARTDETLFFPTTTTIQLAGALLLTLLSPTEFT